MFKDVEVTLQEIAVEIRTGKRAQLRPAAIQLPSRDELASKSSLSP